MGEATEKSLFETVIFVTSSGALKLLVMLSCIVSVSPRFISPKFSGSGEREIVGAGGPKHSNKTSLEPPVTGTLVKSTD